MYKPRKPDLTLAQLLATKAVEPYSSQPSKHSLKNFHINPFVRMLASHPKFDIFVRRIYPSFMLVKCGVVSEHVIGPINANSTVPGKRVHFSSCLNTTSKLQKQIKGFFQNQQKEYGAFEFRSSPEHITAFVRTEIVKLVTEYTETADPIISVTNPALANPESVEGNECRVIYLPTNASDLKGIGIPDKIRGSSTGTKLTGLIYKYLYMNNQFPDQKSGPEWSKLWLN